MSTRKTKKNIKSDDDSSNKGEVAVQSSKSSTAIRWLGSLMFVQFVAKITHFALGLVLVRFISPENYGISALQLPFVAMAITRLLKEAVHRTAVRENKERKLQHLAVVWLSVPFTVIVSSFIGFFYIANSETVVQYPWMIQGFLCWLVSSWLEILIEPIVIYLESELLMNTTVVVECLSVLVQSSIILLLLFVFSEDQTVLALVQSYGQLAYSGTMAFGYYYYAFIKSPNVIKSVWPKTFAIESKTLKEMRGFLIQSFGKYITAEGEHAILFFFANPQQQGIYEFVANLGSIVARIAFQSIEKTGFVMFSNCKNEKEERRKIWKMLMNVSLMISLLYLSVCPTYIQFLINLVYGAKWGNTLAPQLLALYGVYLLIIGVNGLVESLRDAVSDYKKIEAQLSFTAFSIVSYIIVGSTLMYYFGAVGLIIGSCLSAAMRTYYNTYFFRDSLFSIKEGIPQKSICIAYFVIFSTGQFARFVLGDTWKLFGFGVVQGGVFLLWVAFFQRDLIGVVKMIKNKKA